MPTVAAHLKDVLDEFRFHLGNVKHVAAAYCTIEMNPPKLHIWTLLDARDDANETQLAVAERKVRTSFPQIDFDFTTTHLRGRDPVQFIPEGATPIKIQNPAVLRYFQQSLSAA